MTLGVKLQEGQEGWGERWDSRFVPSYAAAPARLVFLDLSDEMASSSEFKAALGPQASAAERVTMPALPLGGGTLVHRSLWDQRREGA